MRQVSLGRWPARPAGRNLAERPAGAKVPPVRKYHAMLDADGGLPSPPPGGPRARVEPSVELASCSAVPAPAAAAAAASAGGGEVTPPPPRPSRARGSSGARGAMARLARNSGEASSSSELDGVDLDVARTTVAGEPPPASPTDAPPAPLY